VSTLRATSTSLERARTRIIGALADARHRPPASALDTVSGEIVVYGAGGIGHAVLSALARRGLRPRCFLDRDRTKVAVQEVPVLHPSDNALTRNERAQMTVLLALFNPDVEPGEIRSLLGQQGYGRVIGFLELHRELAADLGSRYWLTSHDFYEGHEAEILEALELWSDDGSRDLYASILAGRLSADDTIFPQPTLDDQYFPATLPPLPSPVRLVDCGAYTGDTLADAIRRGIDLDEVCAFEPDPENFRTLTAWARTRPVSASPALFLWPCAVGRSAGVARFRSGVGGASGLMAEGDSAVPCVALDDVIGDFRATLLKLDIEGAELEALEGATGLIRRAKPRLAVCVYHRPDHLWTVPLFVRRQHPAYDLLLRLHRFNAFDLVMYALPRA
jgi:FkbM family methyltransferase